MIRTEAFNKNITSHYEREMRMPGLKKMAHISSSPSVIQIREGDIRYSQGLSIRIDQRPQVALKLADRLTYREEMAGRSFVRKMKKAELIYKNMEQTLDAAGLKRELEGQYSSQTKLNEIKKEIVQQSREEVHYTVKKQMREQTGALTEKVYRRLEQKLQDEKRRRGY